MKIKKEMLIAEVLQQAPETIDIMMKYGLHCIGCHVSAYESIEDGCRAHGMSDEDIDKMVKEMNDGSEGDKSALSVSKEAIQALRKELENTKNGLRVSEKKGNFVAEIVSKSEKNDIVLESSGLRVFIEKKSEEKLKGKRLHFKDGEYVIE